MRREIVRSNKDQKCRLLFSHISIQTFKVLIINLFIFIDTACFSQSWPKIFGDNISAYGEDILEQYDLGYSICGSILKDGETFKFGWLIKTDINGNILWDKKFGLASQENYFLDFDNTIDQGLIISGATSKQDIQQDPLIMKINPCGEIEWCKIFLSPGFNTAKGIIALPNGEFIGMLQYYGGDYQNIRISLVKMDSSGEPVWINHLAQEDSTVHNEEGNKLYLVPDSSIIVCANCQSKGMKPFWIKTDTSGSERWELKWQGGSGNANYLELNMNGTYYSSGFFKIPGQNNLPTLFKFNTEGTPLNLIQLMPDTIEGGGAGPIRLYRDTSFVAVIGWSDDPLGFEGYSEIWIIDTLGNNLKRRMLYAEPLTLAQLAINNNNKILVTSTMYVDGNWDIYLWKLNSDLEDDSIYTQSYTYDSLCPYQIVSDTVDLDCSLFVKIDEIPTKEVYETTVKISPNPAKDWITLTLPDIAFNGNIELKVYNKLGDVVRVAYLSEQPLNISIDISSIPEGIYFILCSDERNRTLTGKFIKSR